MSRITQTQVTRDNISSEPSILPAVIPITDRVGVEIEPIEVSTETIGNSWIVGSSTNGIVGTNTGTQGGGQQVVGGTGRVNTVNEVLNLNNNVRLRFFTTYYNDTGVSTGDWGGGSAQLTSAEIIQSKTVAKRTATITRATLIVDTPTNLTLALSADGGTSFETVTNATEHIFTNTGTDLKFKLTAGGTASITQLSIKYS